MKKTPAKAKRPKPAPVQDPPPPENSSPIQTGGPQFGQPGATPDPTKFVQKQPVTTHNTINVWGETLGAAVPDDYDKLVHSFDAAHPTGYELADMTKILAGYHQFLDERGFRKAFPTDSSLFQAI